QDDKEGALKALKTHDEKADTFGIGAVPYYIRLLESGETLPKIDTPKQQAARALTDPSLLFFFRRRSVDGAEIYLRFARWIDPTYDKANIWLGDLLDNSDREDEAYEITNQIPVKSPYYVSAQLSAANYYFAREEDEQALNVLETLNASHPSFITRDALGRARLIREDYAGALPFYTDIINSMSEEDLKENIDPLRNRGIIYESIDQWDLAEKDFKHVLELVPDDVNTLNYLGYTWVDRGENLTEAFEMIRKAVAAEPESGAIVDSLGWAHYKLGQYTQAKEKLEDAVELSPSSATIIDHLGDVYWKLGRKREAGFQWKRALEFDPSDEEKTSINIKLKSGLEAALRAQ
ncbi:MAG: tetratricopeptide repeat protein, partial [Litorimonas sp.]